MARVTPRLVAGLALGLLASASSLAVGNFRATEGVNYYTLRTPQPAPKDKIQVIEFYSFGCPHCAEFEGSLQAWLGHQGKDIEFKRVPATFNPFFAFMARIHYALEDVKATEKLAPAIFNAIHQSRDPALLRPLGEMNRQQQNSSASPEDKAKAENAAIEAFGMWLSARGVDRTQFLRAVRSPSNRVRVAQAETTFRSYGALGVPAFGIDGRYFTTVGRPLQNRNYAEVLDTVDHLIGEARKSRSTKR